MDDPAENQSSGPFPPTRITLIERIRSPEESLSQEALEEFFQAYWFPLYSFLRAQGETHENASDLLQGFIVNELLQREQIKSWDSTRGRLRTFLKVALDRFRKREYRKESAIKRGGPKASTHVSMDFEWAEGHYANTAIDHDSPDRIFEKAWAEATVRQVITRLASEYATRDRQHEFQLLCRNLSARAGEGDHVNYREIADKLGTSENNVKQKMLSFRKQFRRTLENVVSEFAGEGEIDEEVRFVSNLMTGRSE